jgi:hypothetical protein
MASIVRKNRACSGTSCADARDTSAAHAGPANRVRRRIGSRMPGLPNRKRARMSAAETGVSGLPCAGLVLDGPDLVARRARRSRKTSDAIPRGESLPCDPRRSHAIAGASVHLADVVHPHPYSPRDRAQRRSERRRFSRLAEAGRVRPVPSLRTRASRSTLPSEVCESNWR